MATILRAAVRYGVARRPQVSVAAVPNLLLTTLVVAAAAAPFRPAEALSAPQRRPSVQSFVPHNQLPIGLIAAPNPGKAAFLSPATRRTTLSADATLNLLLSTLEPQAIAASYPEFLSPQAKRPLRQDTTSGFLPSNFPSTTPPFSAAFSWLYVEWRRVAPTDTSRGGNALQIPARAEPFFASSSYELVQRPYAVTSESWSSSKVLLEAILVFPPFTPPQFESVWPAARLVLPAASWGLPLAARPITLIFPQPTHQEPLQKRALRQAEQPQVGLGFFPQVFPPFAPVDVQRPQVRSPVRFELPPNLQPLFSLAPPPKPFAFVDWPAPVEWTWTFNPNLPETFRVDVIPPAALANAPSYARWLIVEARSREIEVEPRLRTVQFR